MNPIFLHFQRAPIGGQTDQKCKAPMLWLANQPRADASREVEGGKSNTELTELRELAQHLLWAQPDLQRTLSAAIVAPA